MRLRNAGGLGGREIGWQSRGRTPAAGPPRGQSSEEFRAQRARRIAEARRLKAAREAAEFRRTGRTWLRDMAPDPGQPNVLTYPPGPWDAAFEASVALHKLLGAYFQEHDLGAQARDQSYLYGPRNGYNPNDNPEDHWPGRR